MFKSIIDLMLFQIVEKQKRIFMNHDNILWNNSKDSSKSAIKKSLYIINHKIAY